MEELLSRHMSGHHSSENTSTKYLTSKSTNISVSQKMSLEEYISRRTDHLLNNLTCCWRAVQSCILQQCFYPNWTPKGWAKKGSSTSVTKSDNSASLVRRILSLQYVKFNGNFHLNSWKIFTPMLSIKFFFIHIAEKSENIFGNTLQKQCFKR